ncbi:phytoene desaturase family protein [Teredinibacter purpureus]|uniref:phytoene desaturase family protein n=1 Tax=Teredinibacter purpureus TaxID=2731756 RepID=UPI0005F7983C|nr:FAD-dependent oxidoreductase [Teredinibacter purpureus]
MVPQSNTNYDVIVVGAGLSGLVSAIKLQRSGKRVLLLDKNERVGGLCGTFTQGGYEFTIACNDFGQGLVKLFKSLDVDVVFEQKKTVVHYLDALIEAPLGGAFIKALVSNEPKQFLRFIGGLIKAMLGRGFPVLGQFAEQTLAPGLVRDIVQLPAYLMGVAPYDLPSSFIGLDGKYGYGYTKPATPVGGPQVMADALAKRFTSLGGVLCLGVYAQKQVLLDNQYQILIDSGEIYTANALVNSTEQVSLYEHNTKRGVPLSMLLLTIDKSVEFPVGVHTLVHYPPNIETWFPQIDRGEWPEAFAFHIFKSDIKGRPDCYTLNCFFYMPRGITSPSLQQQQRYRTYIDAHIETLLPGVLSGIQYEYFMSPDDFETRHGMSSRVMPYIHQGAKPDNIDLETGIYRAGHTVYPPGDHAGAAVLSGALVAEKIINA